MECRLRTKSQQRSGQSEDAGFVARQAKQTRENDRPKHPYPTLCRKEAGEGPTFYHPRTWLPREGSRFLALVLLLLLCGGCAQIKRVDYADLAGNPCQTIKVRPDWYTAETSTACIRSGQVVAVETHHTDLSMFDGAAAMLAAILAVGVL
jgi:hypothetical protein